MRAGVIILLISIWAISGKTFAAPEFESTNFVSSLTDYNLVCSIKNNGALLINTYSFEMAIQADKTNENVLILDTVNIENVVCEKCYNITATPRDESGRVFLGELRTIKHHSPKTDSGLLDYRIKLYLINEDHSKKLFIDSRTCLSNKSFKSDHK